MTQVPPQYVYDVAERLVEFTDQSGKTAQHVYDVARYLISEADATRHTFVAYIWLGDHPVQDSLKRELLGFSETAIADKTYR